MEEQNKEIQEFGQITVEGNTKDYKIHLISVIGEIEGHECLPANSKTTKYEHV